MGAGMKFQFSVIVCALNLSKISLTTKYFKQNNMQLKLLLKYIFLNILYEKNELERIKRMQKDEFTVYCQLYSQEMAEIY